MPEEKILDGEILKEEQLDKVAGGTRIETFADGNELYKRGLLSEEDILFPSRVRNLLHRMGYTGYEDKDGIMNGNIYTDKKGNVVTREEFWKNFDADSLKNWGS